jgi:hypothetical protein
MQYNNVAVRLYTGNVVMFLMTVLYSLIKTATKTDAMFAVCGIRGRYSIGLCSFNMTFLYSMKTDYAARRNGVQVAQHLIVPDPLR